jgi:hypothetical protein
MRHYIRHPFEVPIKYRTDEAGRIHEDDMRNISEGGLCFRSEKKLEMGLEIVVNISVQKPPFEAKGYVMWCKEESDHWEIGVQFDNTTTDFSMRMVEQICYIEQYRKDVARYEGRDLAPDDAAEEWIKKFAKSFPGAE